MFTQLKEGREYSFQIGLSSKDILEQQSEEMISYFDSSLHQKKEVLNAVQKDNVDIPISIFQDGESGLKAITHFLKDEKKFNFAQIANLLNRDQRTIWTSYNQEPSQKKTNKKINKKHFLNNEHIINSSLFKERKLSILETITVHLLKNYSIKEVAKLLCKNQMTIYTVKQRAEKKLGKKIIKDRGTTK